MSMHHHFLYYLSLDILTLMKNPRQQLETVNLIGHLLLWIFQEMKKVARLLLV